MKININFNKCRLISIGVRILKNEKVMILEKVKLRVWNKEK